MNRSNKGSSMESGRIICIPESVRSRVEETQGKFFEHLAKIDPSDLTNDLLDERKAIAQAEILQRQTTLQGKKVLEVGVGLGVNFLCWAKLFSTDSYGVEPDTVGFDTSFQIARELASANNFDAERIVPATGEALPFPDNSFDVVYSSNVLEHTDVPKQVLREALRVLRPGGTLQFVFPSYHSYYDGHYGVFHPPVFWRGFFPWYVKFVFGRDPAFAKTLRTELNPAWAKRTVRELDKEFNIQLVGLGEDVFFERMTTLNFYAWATLGRIKRVLAFLSHPSMRKLLARCLIQMRGWSPIILTIRKLR